VNSLDVEPIERSSLVDIVRDRLISMIQRGALKPEDRIVESRLAQNLGVSRSPVREALRQLEQQGLVASSVGRGYRVPLLDERDYRELTQLRIALERLAVRMLVDDGLSAASEKRLRSIVEEMRRATAQSTPDLATLTMLDSRFHAELCRLAGNARLVVMRESIAGQVALALAAFNRSFPGTRHFAERHEAIIDAITSGDGAAAERVITDHILAGWTQMSGDGSAVPIGA
jgi:DNA-binding GntR family transcriptional regulator